MPIVIKAQGNDHSQDLIKRFKKAAAATDIVQKAKDRRYNKRPSQKKAVYKTEIRRLRKRARALKKMKNISPVTLERIAQRLSTS